MGIDVLRARHQLLRAVRSFFLERGYLEVETPYLTPFAPSDAHIEPVTVFVAEKGPFFLHTSPETGMKKLLALGCERIFQICKVFRVEELEEHHNTEFTMLEWYMPGSYREAMVETEQLVRWIAGQAAWRDSAYATRCWKTYDLGALCHEHTGFNPLVLDRDRLLDALREHGFMGTEHGDTWEDLFFKLFLQEVEPHINPDEPYFIEDWPVAVSSMAKRKDAHRVERFELYMRGLEIANGYTELLDAEEQRVRFQKENDRRKKLGRKPLPVDEEFLAALARVKGPCAGVSVGLDRLLMVLLEKRTIGEVLCNRFRP